MRSAMGLLGKKFAQGDLFGRWGVRHPYAAAFLLLLGIPLVLLAAVSLCTIVMTLPIALIMGW